MTSAFWSVSGASAAWLEPFGKRFVGYGVAYRLAQRIELAELALCEGCLVDHFWQSPVPQYAS